LGLLSLGVPLGAELDAMLKLGLSLGAELGILLILGDGLGWLGTPLMLGPELLR
jgi:hypothetical protein